MRSLSRKKCYCGKVFSPFSDKQIYCSKKCSARMSQRASAARRRLGMAMNKRSPKYTLEEIAILRQDPRASLPGRTQNGIYIYCKTHGIDHDHSVVEKRPNKKKYHHPYKPNHNRKRDLLRHQERIRRDGGKAVNERFKQIAPYSARRTEIIAEAFLYIMDHRCTPEEAVKEASKTVSRFYAEEFRTCEFNDAWMQMPDAE